MISEAKKQELKEIKIQLDVLVKKNNLNGGLNSVDAIKYQQLTSIAKSLVFELAKPINIETLPSESDRESTLPAEIVKIAQSELLSDKRIYDAISEAACGVYFNSNTPVDIILEKGEIDIYSAFNNTREALKKQFGGVVKLYRAVGNQRDKLTTNWATTKSFASKFGNNVIEMLIPVEKILAVNTGISGKYHEIIVIK
jgi:hypothetical protein